MAAYEQRRQGPVAISARWRKHFWAGERLRAAGGPRRVPVEIEALAYRGRFIRQAMTDYIAALHHREADSRATHVIGYIGHNYLLDTRDDLVPAVGHGERRTHPVGTFALSCYGDTDIRPSIEVAGVLILNRGLTYPGAWTVGGLAAGLARGLSPRRLHALAADAFAEGKGRPAGSMRRVFAYGDRAGAGVQR